MKKNNNYTLEEFRKKIESLGTKLSKQEKEKDLKEKEIQNFLNKAKENQIIEKFLYKANAFSSKDSDFFSTVKDEKTEKLIFDINNMEYYDEDLDIVSEVSLFNEEKPKDFIDKDKLLKFKNKNNFINNLNIDKTTSFSLVDESTKKDNSDLVLTKEEVENIKCKNLTISNDYEIIEKQSLTQNLTDDYINNVDDDIWIPSENDKSQQIKNQKEENTKKEINILDLIYKKV